jgi:uncharacterized membrane protein
MTIAAVSLIAGMVAFYLHLYKLGLAGNLSCSGGGCAKAIFSTWGSFLGIDVGLIGAIGYALILVTSIISLQPRLQQARWPVNLLALLATLGFLFTLRLKYGEFVVLRTFCPWCAISAVSITIILVLALIEWRKTSPGAVPT